MKRTFTYCIVLIFLLTFGCHNDNQNIITVDFSNSTEDNAVPQVEDTLKPINVAVGAMISPKETFTYYRSLFDYFSITAHRPVVFKQKKTYKEVNEMLLKNEVDIAFVCSGAYVEDDQGMDLLVAPQCNGFPYYQAYIIVNSSSDIQCFEDIKGKTFVFTDPLSNTGKLYAEKRIKEMNTTCNLFFSKTMYSYAHDISIQMVSKNVVDGATIDGLVYEYLAFKSPERVRNIRIIEKSEFYGIPPIVTSKGIDTALKNDAERFFLNLHEDEKGREILNQLLIDKFVIVQDSIYDNIRLVNQYLAR